MRRSTYSSVFMPRCGTESLATDELKREILKNIPSVEQAITQLIEGTSLRYSYGTIKRATDIRPSSGGYEQPPRRRKLKVEQRIERIRARRDMDTEVVDVARAESVKYVVKPVKNLRLDLSKDELNDQRVERLRQTARSFSVRGDNTRRRASLTERVEIDATGGPAISTISSSWRPQTAFASVTKRKSSRKSPDLLRWGTPPDHHAEQLVSKYLEMENDVSRRSSHHSREEFKKTNFSRKALTSTLSPNIWYHIFRFLDLAQLIKCFGVCKVLKLSLMDAARSMFTSAFGRFPSSLSDKSLLWVLRRFHEMQPKGVAELFFWTAARGYTKFVVRVIAGWDIPPMKGGINVASKNDEMTALHIACRHNQLEVLHVLLTADGLDVNRLTASGKHAINFTINQNRLDLLKPLLSHPEVEVDSSDHEGLHLLHHACIVGNCEVVGALLITKANPALVDKEGRTALYIACELGNTDIVQLLLEHPKVDIEFGSTCGKTPLYISSENGHVEVIRGLLAAGANPRRGTYRNKLPLHITAELGNEEACRALLLYTMEEDLLKLTSYDATPLFMASRHPNRKIKMMFDSFSTEWDKWRSDSGQFKEDLVNSEEINEENVISRRSWCEKTFKNLSDKNQNMRTKSSSSRWILEGVNYLNSEKKGCLGQNELSDTKVNEQALLYINNTEELVLVRDENRLTRIIGEHAEPLCQRRKDSIFEARKRALINIAAEGTKIAVTDSVKQRVENEARSRCHVRSISPRMASSLTPWEMALSEEKNMKVTHEKKPFGLSKRVVVMPKVHQALIESESFSRTESFSSPKDLEPVIECAVPPVKSKNPKLKSVKPYQESVSLLSGKSECRPSTVDIGKSINLAVDKTIECKSSSIFKGRKSIACSTVKKSSSKSKAPSVDWAGVLEKSKSPGNAFLQNSRPKCRHSKMDRQVIKRLDGLTSRSRPDGFYLAGSKSKSCWVGLESSSPPLGTTWSCLKDPESISEHAINDIEVAYQIDKNLPMNSQNSSRNLAYLQQEYIKSDTERESDDKSNVKPGSDILVDCLKNTVSNEHCNTDNKRCKIKYLRIPQTCIARPSTVGMLSDSVISKCQPLEQETRSSMLRVKSSYRFTDARGQLSATGGRDLKILEPVLDDLASLSRMDKSKELSDKELAVKTAKRRITRRAAVTRKTFHMFAIDQKNTGRRSKNYSHKRAPSALSSTSKETQREFSKLKRTRRRLDNIYGTMFEKQTSLARRRLKSSSVWLQTSTISDR